MCLGPKIFLFLSLLDSDQERFRLVQLTNEIDRLLLYLSWIFLVRAPNFVPIHQKIEVLSRKCDILAAFCIMELSRLTSPTCATLHGILILTFILSCISPILLLWAKKTNSLHIPKHQINSLEDFRFLTL
ncbi:hypothetical protein AMTRI_Chr09g16740 [Amborella trichopoda]